MIRAAPLGTAEQLTVEAARGDEVVHWKGEVEGRQAHARRHVIASVATQSGRFVDCFVVNSSQ
jgi:hypothetical protein